MPRADIFAQGGHESRDGIVAAPFQGAENGHQNPLGQRALVAAGAVYDFAEQHREADLPLPVVVGRGDLRMIQKREELIPVFLQQLGHAPHGQAAAAAVHEIDGDRFGGEAPQPVGHPVHPPSGLVRVPDLGDQGFVPEEQDLAQRAPLPDHAAFRPGEAQMIVESLEDLREGHPQRVMPIGGQPQQAVADGRESELALLRARGRSGAIR